MAREWEWVVGEQNTQVRVSIGIFGRVVIEVDGREVQRATTVIGMKTTSIALPSGAQAEFRYGSSYGTAYRCELRVAGKLLLPQIAPKDCPVALSKCPGCKAPVRASDRFCDACGKGLPSAEEVVGMKEVQRGNSTIGGLGFLFLISGALLYVGKRMTANKALAQIAGLDADAPLTRPIPGVAARTIGELRSQIHFVLGLVFGWLRVRSGSLYPGMLAHAAWNASVVWAELSGR